MPITQSPLLNKISRAASAMKGGQLEAYAPAKNLKHDDQKVQSSWGPQMRI